MRKIHVLLAVEPLTNFLGDPLTRGIVKILFNKLKFKKRVNYLMMEFFFSLEKLECKINLFP